MYTGQRLTCAERRRNISPGRCDTPCRSPIPRRHPCNSRPCSAHRRNLNQQRYTPQRASTRAQTTLKKPSTIYEDPELGFAPRSSARPKSRSHQQSWSQQWLMTFPCFLISFLVFFSVYWVYKYSSMQTHALSDFSVNKTDKIMRSGATIDDGQSGSSEGSSGEDGSIFDGRKDFGTEYGVSEGTTKDGKINRSQIDDGGGTTEDEENDQGIVIEIGSTDGSGRGVSKDSGEKDGGKSGGGDSGGIDLKKEYGRKHGVGKAGDQTGSSERSGEESVVKKISGLSDVYEDIGDADDDGKQVSDKIAGGLGVIVELSGKKGGGERGVRQDVEGQGGGKVDAWDVIGFGGRGYPGANVVGGNQGGGLDHGVDRKVVSGLGGGRAQGDSRGQGRGGSKVIGGNVVGDFEIEVQVATEDRGRLIDDTESGVRRGSKVSDSKRVLGREKNKVGGHLVSPKDGDSESDMEEGGEGDDGWEGDNDRIDDDAENQGRSWDDNGDQFARRQGGVNSTKAPVEHCLSFGANWSKCWLKWSAAILAITALTIVIFCCMNILCWFVYLIILLVLITFYVLKFVMRVI